MKRFAMLAIWGGLFAGSALAGETYYVSKVEKGSVNTFLNRFATPTHQIVVTKTPPASSEETHAITVADGETLVVRELHAKASPAFAGEKARMDGFAFIVAPKSKQFHMHPQDEPRDYLEPVGREEIRAEPLKNKWEDASDDAGGLSSPIEEAFLRTKISQYSGEEAITVNGQSIVLKERGSAAGRQKARAYLMQEYRALGFTVTEENYGSGANVVAEKAGSDPSKVLLVTSHLDSMSNAGADDDGAGTISALAIANALKGKSLKHTLRIVAFDEEEVGLVGSSTYVRMQRTAGTLGNILGVVNLEMTGYDSDNDGGVHVIDCRENTSASLTAQVMAGVAREGVALRKVEACTNRSDHAAFWRYNVPAIVISQNFFGGDDNPCYHRSCDKMDRMNFTYMKSITTAVASAVTTILQAQ